MLQYQANSREGHLETLYLIFHFLSKNLLRRLVFDAKFLDVTKMRFT